MIESRVNNNDVWRFLTYCVMFYSGAVWHGYENFTDQQRRDRDSEVIQALSLNLNNTLVEKVHLLYYKDNELQVNYGEFQMLEV